MDMQEFNKTIIESSVEPGSEVRWR